MKIKNKSIHNFKINGRNTSQFVLKKEKVFIKRYLHIYIYTHTHYNYLLWPFSLVFGWPQSLQVKWDQVYQNINHVIIIHYMYLNNKHLIIMYLNITFVIIIYYMYLNIKHVIIIYY